MLVVEHQTGLFLAPNKYGKKIYFDPAHNHRMKRDEQSGSVDTAPSDVISWKAKSRKYRT